MTKSHGEIFGLVPYGFRPPTLARVQEIFWNAEDECFPWPTLFGGGCTANLRSVPRHPWQAFLLAASVTWRLCTSQNSGRER